MYIYPNTDLYILKNVSLNNDYDHTIYFGSELAQRNFFSNNLRVKWVLNNQSYQRKERGWIQVNLNQNDLWDCTYLMYRNTSYKNKWFYAFILSVDYVNDGVSRINFEIDVIQTWMFDYQLDKCFVEREHTTSDNLFENLVEENLDIGTDLSVQLYRRYDLTPNRVGVVYTSDVDTTTNPPSLLPVTMRKIGNYFSGVGLISFDMSTTAGWNNLGSFLHDYIDNGFEDAILSVYQYPDIIGPLLVNPYQTVSWTITANFVNIDGYVPKNKKLFNYPYNFLKLSNNKGDDCLFKHEMWDSSHRGEFKLTGVGVGIPTVMCYPCYYRDIAEDYENGLVYSGFNQCAWIGDAYQVWLAQNRKNLDLAAMSGVGALLVGGALYAGGASAGSLPMITLPSSAPVNIGAGNLLGKGNQPINTAFGGGSTDIGSGLIKAGSGAIIGSIYNWLCAKNKLEATPRPAHGQINNDIFNSQVGISGYICYQMTIKNEYAKIIDEYFSRFGYACHRIKVPNRNARQNWTYTKTIGCEIVGNLPSDDVAKIKSIYDKGITFWNDGLNVGYYGDFTNPVYS